MRRVGRFLTAALTASLVMICAPNAVLAVPPPPGGIAIDCETTAYASEQLICSDPALLLQEARLLEAYQRAADARDLTARATLEADQRTWMATRNKCAFRRDGRRCLVVRYRQRIEALERAASRP